MRLTEEHRRLRLAQGEHTPPSAPPTTRPGLFARLRRLVFSTH